LWNWISIVELRLEEFHDAKILVDRIGLTVA